jgi:hypothetical protein
MACLQINNRNIRTKTIYVLQLRKIMKTTTNSQNKKAVIKARTRSKGGLFSY